MMVAVFNFGRRLGILACLGCVLTSPQPGQADQPVTVLAASNLMAVLDPLARSFGIEHGVPVRVIYGPSQVLENELAHGVKADAFFPVGKDWMDRAQAAGLILQQTRVDLLTSHLVLIAPQTVRRQIVLGDGTQLPPFLGAHGVLAICDPGVEDSGRHSEAALKAMGLCEGIAGRLIFSASPNEEIQAVTDGEAALAVGFDTDVVNRPSVEVVCEFPDGTHPRIVYPVAATASGGPDVMAFLAYFKSPEAASAFRQSGYIYMPDAAQP